MRYQTRVTIGPSFRELIKSQKYESHVLAIINSSTEIFDGRTFYYVHDQSHGECDFEDSDGRKYDAKLVFDKRLGKLVGDCKYEFNVWLQAMVDEQCEFSESIKQRNPSLIRHMSLYTIMKERLASVRGDEHAILFLPYPIVLDSPDTNTLASFFLQCTDYLQAVYETLLADGCVRCQGTYFIYPSTEPQVYVLRDSNRRREFISYNELGHIIEFDTRAVANK